MRNAVHYHLVSPQHPEQDGVIPKYVRFYKILGFLVQRGAFDNITDISVLSNPEGVQNISSLGLCDKDIYLKNYA